MKKALAIILSIVMLLGVMPFASFAADEAVYDRAKVASNDEAYVADMTAEQMASVILDWVDREIAKYSAEIQEDIVAGVIANGGFEEFEAFLGEDALGNIIADAIGPIDSLDAVVGYKDYLAELGGDFANLDAASLITREEAGSAIGFIDGVFQFMADNSEIFGKVFRWDEEVFDYGKVGEYIETLNGSENADEQAIYDFYVDYLIGNDIQAKFTKWVADQMNYEIPEGETFDDTLNNGIMAWFSGLCEANGILSEEALAELRTYDLRTTDIYTLVKNFVALAEADNEVEIDTYYNYLLDTVVRSLLKTALGQKAVVGADAELPASFAETYTDLALLAEISGGQLYYQDGENYYQVTVADGTATAKALTWETVVDFEFPTATIYTGADFDKEVQVYYPTSADAVQVLTYATAKNQALIGDTMTFNGTEVPAEFAALMTDANAKALEDGFGLTVKQGDEVISELKLTFKEIEEYAEAQALPVAQSALESAIANMPFAMDITLDAVDVVLSYNGWATEDEFICQVTVDSVKATLGGSMASMVQSVVDTAATTAIGSTIDNPVATVVVDGISGGKGIDASGAKELLEFLDTDFVIDKSLLDFTANYDAYNGVVGQANRVLYDLVDMLVSDAGMEKLALEEGMNDKFTSNLEKICATANDMMASAEAIMTDPEVEALLGQAGIDMSALLGNFDLDLLYAINFESVEDLWVSVITLGLDLIDGGSNETITEIHALIGDLSNLDAMAVAIADYVLGKCIPDLNKAFADAGVDFALTVPTATDAKAVADGAGKDIIMTKAADLLYEAAVEGVALVNSIANEALAAIGAETGIEMPTVAFELGVTKGADWQATLAALVARVYELADGIIIACDNEYTDTFDKIAAVANAVLPLGSLASNCASDNFAFDVNKVMGFLFDDGLEGDLDGFLRLFETKVKTEDVAADVSVTEALIEASEHIVDAFFPDTVKAELYVNLADYSTVTFTEITVQEYFTSAENDALIASNNMDSINARKADLVPAVLNLVREAGVLTFFAKCDKDHTAADLETVTIAGKAATCTEAGVEDAKACAECGYIVSGGGAIAAPGHSWGAWAQTTAPKCETNGVETRTCGACGTSETKAVAATGHVTWSAWTVTVAPSCDAKGLETRTCSCGKTETRDVAATGHPDADGNKVCDVCGHDWNEEEVDNSFFGKIKAFFMRIIEWFRNLFS
ncbi:MAG: hypothetical protein IKJ27_03035 [Clostridia bacterium]|nr:hypothetical protein [Clostridia bacterium]